MAFKKLFDALGIYQDGMVAKVDGLDVEEVCDMRHDVTWIWRLAMWLCRSL